MRIVITTSPPKLNDKRNPDYVVRFLLACNQRWKNIPAGHSQMYTESTIVAVFGRIIYATIQAIGYAYYSGSLNHKVKIYPHIYSFVPRSTSQSVAMSCLPILLMIYHA